MGARSLSKELQTSAGSRRLIPQVVRGMRSPHHRSQPGCLTSDTLDDVIVVADHQDGAASQSP
jgi:hypothetical protein